MFVEDDNMLDWTFRAIKIHTLWYLLVKKLDKILLKDECDHNYRNGLKLSHFYSET